MAGEAKTERTAVSGVVLLDKPQGLSSNAALQRVRRAFGAGKAGHAGTLDPLATGMLPILLGEATKLAGHLLHKDKAYQVRCRLGQSTTTYDAEGEITLERPIPVFDHAALTGLVSEFTGRIRQRAPAYSAIKQGGQPLYKRARRGEAVVAPEREVEITAIEARRVSGTELELAVECGSGTYIRSLVHDLGERLGCGGHVTVLRRLWVSPFRGQPMHGLDAVMAGEVAPMPALAAIPDWPRLDLGEAELAAVRNGRSIHRADLPIGHIAGLDGEGRLTALLSAEADGTVHPIRLLHA